MNDKRAEIARYHATWNRETQQNLTMRLCDYEKETAYLELINAGHTESEMVQVVRYLQGEIRKGKRQPAALRWSNVIGNELRFSEELVLARGAARLPKPSTRLQEAMTGLRPVVTERPVTNNTRSAAELIAALRAAAGMRAT